MIRKEEEKWEEDRKVEGESISIRRKNKLEKININGKHKGVRKERIERDERVRG